MKSIKYLSATVFCFFILSSCSDSFFEKYPSDSLTEGTFYTSGDNVKMMLNDAYFTTRSVYSWYFYFGDLASDDSYNSKFNNSTNHITINESNVTSSNGALSGIWQSAYNVIARCNIVLEQAENVEMDAALKAQYQNEARFIRALMYFNLVQIFGDVPLVLKDVKTSDEAFAYGRETVENVYKQIVEDLKTAKALPSSYAKNEDRGRATQWSAKSLLGKVYLTRKNYQDAATELKDVIDNSPHSLLDSYERVFDADNPNNAEVIFAIQYAKGFDPAMGNPFVTAAFPNEEVGAGFLNGVLTRGTGTFLMTEELYALYADGDKRKSEMAVILGLGSQQYRYIFTLKYYDKGMAAKVDAGNDWIVLRFADVLLMYAEVQNELQNPNLASDYVDKIRKRAGLDVSVPVAANQADMRLAIELERRKELFCEGHRWFDLVRTGRCIEVMNAHFNSGATNNEIGSGCSVEPHELIFPIPNDQVLLNPDRIKQNPKY